MKVITTREMVRHAKDIFEMAEQERVAIKRGNKYINLIVTEDPGTEFITENWIKEFMSIPAEYRVNPFDVSPSGDIYFADKRNVEYIKNARTGRVITLSEEEEKALFSL